MDPVSHGVVGAVAVQALVRSREIRVATPIGFVAGMLADLDVLIRDAADPLLAIEYHRQLTHALAFVPVAATLVVAATWPLLGWIRRSSGLVDLGLGRLWCWVALAYGAHPLLDACTTYGTMLLWPFSAMRVAWHVVAVIDPGLTLPALSLGLLALKRRSPRLGRMALLWVMAWLTLGLVQRERADALLRRVVAQRGSTIERGGAKPTLFNLVLWRGVWQSGDTLFTVALRPGWLGPDRVSEVASAPLFRVERELPTLDPASTAMRDIGRFRHFSDGWLVAVESDAGPGRLIGDFRYAALPNEVRPLWAIRVDPTHPHRHADFVPLRNIGPGALARFFDWVRGAGLEPVPADSGR